MAKTRGPLLSMRASGQLGESHIYADWKGIPYARQYVVPNNPQTGPQMLTRQVFAWLNELYRRLGPLALAVWDAYAQRRSFIPRNGLIKINLSALRPEADINNLTLSPGVRSGPSPQGFTAATGPNPATITWTITPGTLPQGWSITRAVAVAIEQQDPHGSFASDPTEQDVPNPGPYQDTMQVPQAATPYLVSAWLEYERPDGTTAYSPSASLTVTSGA